MINADITKSSIIRMSERLLINVSWIDQYPVCVLTMYGYIVMSRVCIIMMINLEITGIFLFFTLPPAFIHLHFQS